jgi:hypothetical protein
VSVNSTCRIVPSVISGVQFSVTIFDTTPLLLDKLSCLLELVGDTSNMAAFVISDLQAVILMPVSALFLLTYCTERSPSLEADQSLQLVKKFPAILWNPKVLYHTHKCPPPVRILSQLHPEPTTPSNPLKMHLNIILPSTSGSPQWFLSLRFPHQHLVHNCLLPHTCHIPPPSHYS